MNVPYKQLLQTLTLYCYHTPMWHVLLFLFFCYAVIGLLISWYQTQIKKNFFGISHWLIILGAFVWTDGVIFGLFWSVTSFILLLYNHLITTLLVFSLFWTVRSAGEIFYWFLEQFAVNKRNPPPTLFLYRFSPNESVWIVMQILWQCILVLCLLADILLIKQF